jgi:hypothetical protein
MSDNCTLKKGSYAIPTNRTGCIVHGGKHGERFDMHADFVDTCACCEYRQYVRGYFQYRASDQDPWITVQHLLRWGTPLSPAQYNEDGFPNGDAYGYRAFNGCSDQFLPLPRTTGCQYRGSDFPGLTVPGGTQYRISLEFKGEIVDTCNSDAVVQGSLWTVACQGVA